MMLILFILLPALAHSQQIFGGRCSDFTNTSKRNFDIDKYSGRWFEIYRYNNVMQMNADCTVVDVSKIDNNSFNPDMTLKLYTPMTMHTKAHFIDPVKRDGKVKVKMPYTPELEYWIVDTDYETYTIEWWCIDLLETNLQVVWVFARRPKIDEKTERKIQTVLKQNNLGKRRMRKSRNDPENCKCIYNDC
ncbi:PREDICTED: apolipoprotein D-like isoform X1 [Nicrophorus vespilloides]|uniref:Apolipoprotein D-like isoform X1 n=1 Tax=Nicrophorus vespilloides TaxID=110193 RepID=A0ABM1M349_NICVS|nr:PREDICTED: apolipoprotein D-like isoform X1 [Nicrophorus vespilloides]